MDIDIKRCDMGPIVANVIVIMVIAVIVGLAIRYLVKAKKKGVKCIGCPAAGTSGCHCNKSEK